MSAGNKQHGAAVKPGLVECKLFITVRTLEAMGRFKEESAEYTSEVKMFSKAVQRKKMQRHHIDDSGVLWPVSFSPESKIGGNVVICEHQ